MLFVVLCACPGDSRQESVFLSKTTAATVGHSRESFDLHDDDWLERLVVAVFGGGGGS